MAHTKMMSRERRQGLEAAEEVLGVDVSRTPSPGPMRTRIIV